jgi:hypothetical protein
MIGGFCSKKGFGGGRVVPNRRCFMGGQEAHAIGGIFILKFLQYNFFFLSLCFFMPLLINY